MNPQTTLASLLCFALPILTLGYAAWCAVFPFRPCRWCKGAGKHRSPIGRTYRLCHHCGATGLRVRWGRRLYTYLRTERTRGHV